MTPTMGKLQRRLNQVRSAAWLPALLLIIVQMASGMREMSQMAFFLLYLQEELGLAPVVISSVVAGAQVAGMLTALMGGAITARLGSKWVLACGLAFSALGSLAFQVQALGPVVVLWVVGGCGLALTTVGGSSYLSRISQRESLGILAALYALSTTIGGAVGNPLAGVLIERSGFQAFGLAAIAVSAFAILVVTLLLPYLHDHAGEPLSLSVFFSGIISTARQRNVRLLIGMRALPTIFYGMLTVLIPLLINNLTGSKVIVAAYGTTNLVVASVAQLLAGRSADRWGARKPTIAAYSALILSGFGLFASAHSLPGLFGFGVLGIAAAWALATLMFVWINDGVSKTGLPSTFGLLHAVWSISMISGSILGGWFVSIRPGLPFLIAGLLNLGAYALIGAYYRKPAAAVQTEVSR